MPTIGKTQQALTRLLGSHSPICRVTLHEPICSPHHRDAPKLLAARGFARMGLRRCEVRADPVGSDRRGGWAPLRFVPEDLERWIEHARAGWTPAAGMGREAMAEREDRRADAGRRRSVPAAQQSLL